MAECLGLLEVASETTCGQTYYAIRLCLQIRAFCFDGGAGKRSNRIGDLLGRVGSLPEILQAFLGPSRGRLGQPTERHGASWVLGSGQR